MEQQLTEDDEKRRQKLLATVTDFEFRYNDITNKYHLQKRFPPHHRVPWRKLVENQKPNGMLSKDWMWLVSVTHTIRTTSSRTPGKKAAKETPKRKETTHPKTPVVNKLPIEPDEKRYWWQD